MQEEDTARAPPLLRRNVWRMILTLARPDVTSYNLQDRSRRLATI
jgi:hypothetical protein